MRAALKMEAKNPHYSEALHRYQALAKLSPQKINGKAKTAGER